MIALRDRRVVLVGGGGFIGHHLALHLTACGASVAIVDSLAVNNLVNFATETPGDDSPHRERYLAMINERLERLRAAGVDLHVQDARDVAPLATRIADLAPDVIVHLAGISHAGKSNRDPQAAFEHLLETLQSSLTAASHGVEHFIYFSSSMVYGHFTDGMVTEASPCAPLGIYGSLKYAGEKMVIAHHQVRNLPYTIIRPSALYGERCISRRVAQIFIEQALTGEELTVAGDGSDRLDFTYIDDLVAGLARVIEHPAARNQVFNLTFGQGRSIGELIDVLRGEFGDIRVNFTPRDRLMPTRGSLCVDKARELIGYEPQWSIERGIPKYVAWYRRADAPALTIDVEPKLADAAHRAASSRAS